MIEPIEYLIYYLNLPAEWNFHSIINIAHLKPAFSEDDPYNRSRPEQPPLIKTKKDTKNIKF